MDVMLAEHEREDLRQKRGPSGTFILLGKSIKLAQESLGFWPGASVHREKVQKGRDGGEMAHGCE